MHSFVHTYSHTHLSTHTTRVIYARIHLHIHINIHRYHTNIYSYTFGLAHGPLSQQPGASYRDSFTRLNRLQAFLDASLEWRGCAFINTTRMTRGVVPTASGGQNDYNCVCMSSEHTHTHTHSIIQTYTRIPLSWLSGVCPNSHVYLLGVHIAV